MVTVSELRDVHNLLFMRAPRTTPDLGRVWLDDLQGRLDAGRHPEAYAHTPDVVTDARVQCIEGHHVFPLCAPEATITAMRDVLTEPGDR